MLFNSAEFIFLFLPIALASFFAIGRFGSFHAALAWLVVLSLVFYAWWRPANVPILILSVAANFALGRLIQISKTDRAAGLLMTLGVAGNLAALVFYKYTHLLTQTISELFEVSWTVQNPTLPLAISFFTFLQIAYLVDVRRERRAEPSLVRYSLFVTFFPHLIAGPLLHHKEMLPQFTANKARSPLTEDLAVGLTMFTFGLFKKLILADAAAFRADKVFEYAATTQLTTAEAWVGAIAYGFQIYFDFSGYTDMAIGLARMFGIRLPVNFDSPYKATSIVEFWRRWHMTLSRFLRDYLYIPLGGNRKGPARRYINIMITMGLGGLWHGASWTFALWGGLHGVYLVIAHLFDRIRRPRSQGPTARWRRIPAIALTFVLVTIAWVPFRANDMAVTRLMWSSMASLDGLSLPRRFKPADGSTLETAMTSLGLRFDGMFINQAFGEVFSGLAILVLLGFVAFALPNSQELLSRFDPALGWRPRDGRKTMTWMPTLPWAIVTGVAFGLALAALAHPVKFIYFNF